MLEKKRKIHFVGLGGVGMSGLALILHKMGHEVSGCDLSDSKYLEKVRGAGMPVFLGHHPSHLEGVEIVVYSSAVSLDHPELKQARELGLWVIPRAKMLAEVMSVHPKSIVVAGSHGKTTTTSMLAELLCKLGLKPTVVVGGIVNNLQSHSLLGEGTYLVAEADESDGSFLYYNPYLTIITNIDREHLDFYADFSAIKKAFQSFILRTSPEGRVILCGDDPGIRETVAELSLPFIFYGLGERNEVRGKVLSDTAYPEVAVYHGEEFLGVLKLQVPGLHNVQNALGVIACALVLGLPITEVLSVLSQFRGVKRRLELKGIAQGALIYDDYAHHPREIEVSLKALKKKHPDKRLILLFQPHRYTRTKALWEDFLLVLKEPDILILTDIYPASEKAIPGVSGEALYQAVKEVRKKKPTFYVAKSKTLEVVKALLSPGDLFVTMGAGDVYKIGEALLSATEERDGKALSA
jgi:UDP-N-acetylmuramate--alanine ligase